MRDFRNKFVWSLMAVLLVLLVGCGGEKSDERSSSAEKKVEESVAPAPKEVVGRPSERLKTGGEGQVVVGALPDGFPSDLLPLYPGGKVERSAAQEGEYTVLQTSGDSEEQIYEFYRRFYENKDWKTTSKVTVAGRTVAGFQGPEKRVDMTLQDRAGGTFFSLVLVED